MAIIGVFELTFAGAQIIQVSQMTVEIWTTVALLYLGLTLSLSLVARRLELERSRPEAPQGGRGEIPFARPPGLP